MKHLNKKFFSLLIAGSLILPAFCFASTLIDYFNSSNNNSVSLYGTDYFGQSFTASENYNLTSVKVNISRGGDAHNLTAAIQEIVGGVPFGVDLCSGSISAPADPTWAEITCGSGTAITKNEIYVLILRYPDGTSTDQIYWNYDNHNYYSGGVFFSSNDSGATWTPNAAIDFNFEIWGEVPPAAISLFNIPVNAIASSTGIASDLINDIFIFLELAIGLPLAFYFVKKWLAMLP